MAEPLLLAIHKKLAKISVASAVLIASILLISAGLASVTPAVTSVSSADDGNGGTHPVSNVEIQIILPPGVDPINPVVSINELITFMAVTTGGAGTLTFTWDFGDGTIIIDGSLIDHAYLSVGTYVLLLSVTDSDPDGVVLGTASDSLTLTILDPNADPETDPEADPETDPETDPDPEPTPQDFVNDLIDLITSSDDDDWKRPNQKNAMLHKLDVLSTLITDGDYADAYRKLLLDIKPKLTTGQTNRCVGHRERVWVVNPDLRSSSLDIINPLLDLLRDLASDPTAESMIAELIDTVSSSDNNDWKKPRFKENMLNKLDRVSTLIDEFHFNRAHFKLLDIKRNLVHTGRCTWIVDPDLKETCLDKIDALLAQLASLSP